MIQRIMGHAIQLPQGLWVRLNIAWVVFFLVCGFANLYVVFTYPNFWVDFKVFGSLGMTLLFLIGQGLFLARHLHDADTGEKPRTDMLYAIIARDIPASQERRLASRPAHLARLEQLKEEGRLVLAGPHPAIDSNDPGAAGFTGSLIVAEFDSPAAQNWAEADPTGPPGCMPRWWSSRSRKSCPEAVAGHRAGGPSVFPANVFAPDAAFRCPPQRNQAGPALSPSRKGEPEDSAIRRFIGTRSHDASIHCPLPAAEPEPGSFLAQAEEPAPAPIPAAQPSIAQATAELERRLVETERQRDELVSRMRQENRQLREQLQAAQAQRQPPLLTEEQTWYVAGAATALLAFVLGALSRGRRRQRREWIN